MSEQKTQQSGDRPTTCPHCGSDMVTGTVDLAQTPDVAEATDQQRAEFNPGEMVMMSQCTNPDCPGGTGAEV